MKASNKQVYKKENLVNYMATRKGVDKNTDILDTVNVLESMKQKELIEELLNIEEANHNILEYEDYRKNPTMANASRFITAFFDVNFSLFVDKENLLDYISSRPNVKKEAFMSHGLFSLTDETLDLEKVKKEVGSHEGIIWTNVISLRREDAEKLGFEDREAWKTVIQSQASNLAKNFKIDVEDLQVYGAFHDEAHHPHAHMIVFSKNKGHEYLSKKGLRNIKSGFANQIFKEELQSIYKKKGDLQTKIKELSEKELNIIYEDSGNELFKTLIKQLETHKGRKFYQYLDPSAKETVNKIFSLLSKEEKVNFIYDKWVKVHKENEEIYSEQESPVVSIMENSYFERMIQNLIINVTLEQSKFKKDNEDNNILSTTKQAETLDDEKTDSILSKENKLDKQNKEEKKIRADTENYIYEISEESDIGTKQKELETETNPEEVKNEKEIKQEILESDTNIYDNDFLLYTLGVSYYFGKDLEQDIAKGLAYLNRSAELGNIYAQKIIEYKPTAPSPYLSLLYHLERMLEEAFIEKYRSIVDKKLYSKMAEKKGKLGMK